MPPMLASRGTCLGTMAWRDRLTRVPKVGTQSWELWLSSSVVSFGLVWRGAMQAVVAQAMGTGGWGGRAGETALGKASLLLL